MRFQFGKCRLSRSFLLDLEQARRMYYGVVLEVKKEIQVMMTLPTWGGLSEFQYEGSVTQGTSIIWKARLSGYKSNRLNWLA
jgi:hypothetical protein